MDAVEFLNEWKRMCKSDNTCNECSIKKICVYNNISPPDSIVNSKEWVELVEQWSQEHPYKTRLQDFLEKYPNAILSIDGTVARACAWELGYCDSCKYVGKGCRECWNEPMK